MAKWSDDTQLRKSEEFQKISQEYVGLSNQELEEKYANKRREKDKIEASLSPVNQHIMVLELLMCERFAEEGLKTVTFDDGGRITVTFETDYSISDKKSFIEWLKTKNMEHELTVHANTAKRIVKEFVVEQLAKVDPDKRETFNVVLPDGMVQSDPVPKLTYTPKK